MKRRVLLAGIGLSSIGVGAAFGSGAFTTVRADRSVELNVNSDDSAQIIFTQGSGVGADRLIGTDNSNAVNVIEFSRTDLNEQSTTTFEKALKIENNTDNSGDGLDLDLRVKETTEIGGGDVLDFRVEGSGSIVGGENENEFRLDATDSVETDIVIDLRDNDIGDGAGDNDLESIEQVTFVVEAVDSGS
ncbi:hypothetical protein GLW36_12670 [Halorubrum terrestre]|uniref:DUF1102 domain-containing protein n=1 Tax=Halorubrum distributum TaxID=29283 RepID=A0A6B1I9H6_9EURY|nr:hypothetical protein [Halorubrum terrestre]MYL17492.1 hypothetical protein [Halorubrum terrestre]